MYEELVKRLRSQCKGYGKECEDCNADGNCRSQMENEAADAIDELQRCLDGVCADNDSLCEQINEAYSKGLLEGGIAQRAEDEKWMPQWIPVT